MRLEKGSITIYLAVIFLAVLLFTGTIVDIARIIVAEKKIENALSSSIRSVLASYDEGLIGQFGIYGVNTISNEDRLNEEAYNYFFSNLIERHNGIDFINYEITRENYNVSGLGNLINKDVFKQQLLEYMKYKAPVTIVENIIEQIKSIKLDKKVEFANASKDVRVKEKEVNEEIWVLDDRIKGIKQKLTKLGEDQLEEIKTDLEKLVEGSRKLYEDKENGIYVEYQKLIENVEQIAYEENFVQVTSCQFDNIIGDCESIRQNAYNIIDGIKSANEIIKPTKRKITNLEEYIQTLENKKIELERELASAELQEGTSEAVINNIIQQIDDIEDSISEASNDIYEYRELIDTQIKNLKDIINNNTIDEIKVLEDNNILPEHTINMIKKYEQKLSQLKDKLLLKIIEENMLISANEYENVIENDMDELEEVKDSINISKNMSEAELEQENGNIIKWLNKLIEVVSGAITDSRDKLYIIEYAMDKYTFLTSKTERNHYFSKGEVEYLISGTDIPYDRNKNTELNAVVNTLAKVYLIRFAVDSIDDFVRSEIPNIWARLSWALVEGFYNAANEMLEMLDGKMIKICPSFEKRTLKYSDHLRILLLFQSEDITIRKMQQLVQVNLRNIKAKDNENNEFKLSEYDTALKGSVKVRINLWFLPMLHLDKLGYKQFQGKYYIVNKDIYLEY